MDVPHRIKKATTTIAKHFGAPLLNPASKKAIAVVLLFLVPIFIGIGFAVQSVDVVGDSSRAIWWFIGAAIMASMLVLVWEEIAAIPKWHRIAVTVLLEILVIETFFAGSRWVARKAEAAADASIRDNADRTREMGMYSSWLKSQSQPQHVASRSQPITPQPRQTIPLQPMQPKT